MKAVVAAFNQEKALVGAFSVITNFRMELFEALVRLLLAAEPLHHVEMNGSNSGSGGVAQGAPVLHNVPPV